MTLRMNIATMTLRMNYAAAAPGGMKASGSVHGYVGQSGRPATLIDLVYPRVSQRNGYAADADNRLAISFRAAPLAAASAAAA